MIGQQILITFTNLGFAIILVLIFLKLKTIGSRLALRQTRGNSQTTGARGLWQSLVRLWQKDDQVPSGINRFGFRLLPLVQLCFWVCMVMILGRDADGKIHGNLISLIAILLTSSFVHYYHVWLLNRKGLILINFKSLELNLIADFFTVISMALMIFRYHTTEFWQIEIAQTQVLDLGIISMPFAAALFALASIYKFSQVPFSRQANPMHSYNSLSDCYSSASHVIVKLIPNLYFIISVQIIVQMWLGGGNSYGYSPIFFADQVKPYLGQIISMSKVVILCTLHQLVFASLPAVARDKCRRWLVGCGAVFIGLQIIILIMIYVRGL